jgi:protein phosphatase
VTPTDQPRLFELPPLELGERSLVVLIGAAGAGKTTFAHKHFRPEEIVSSDECRAQVSGDAYDPAAAPAVFALVHALVDERLAAGRLTVVDATNAAPEHRAPLVALARGYGFAPVALVLALPEALCQERTAGRSDRSISPFVVRKHARAVRRSLVRLRTEGFSEVYVLRSPEDVDAAAVLRV